MNVKSGTNRCCGNKYKLGQNLRMNRMGLLRFRPVSMCYAEGYKPSSSMLILSLMQTEFLVRFPIVRFHVLYLLPPVLLGTEGSINAVVFGVLRSGNASSASIRTTTSMLILLLMRSEFLGHLPIV